MNRASNLFLFFLLYSNDVVTIPYLCDAAPSFLPHARKIDNKVIAEKQQQQNIANKIDTNLPHFISKNNLNPQKLIENDTNPGKDEAKKDPLRRLSINNDHHHESALLRGKQHLEEDGNPEESTSSQDKNMMEVSTGDSSSSSKHFKPQKDTPTLHEGHTVRINNGRGLHNHSSPEYLQEAGKKCQK